MAAGAASAEVSDKEFRQVGAAALPIEVAPTVHVNGGHAKGRFSQIRSVADRNRAFADPPGRTSRNAVWAPGDSILQHMGRRNYLIEGLSGTGKTSVCDELQRRGHHAIHGDRELAYRGDPETGEPMEGFAHEHHIWDVEKVRSLVADQSHAATFFCGGSRNFSKFIHCLLTALLREIRRGEPISW